MLNDFGFIVVPLVIIIALIAMSIRVLREYERGVVFFLGRFQSVKGPGLIIVIPGIQQMVRIDLRVITLDVPSQDVISQDNVTVRVNAVLYFRVVDSAKSVIQVEDYYAATSQLAQTTLRSVLGKHELDEMLSERDKLNSDIQSILDAQTDAWGIKVTNVEIKHVDLDDSMIRAIARQAEAERERRAKVIHAEGELQAAEKLVQASQIMEASPAALQLRYMQTMSDMSTNGHANTIFFPLPLELTKVFENLAGKFRAENPENPLSAAAAAAGMGTKTSSSGSGVTGDTAGGSDAATGAGGDAGSGGTNRGPVPDDPANP